MFNHFLRILSVMVAFVIGSGAAKATTLDLTLSGSTPGTGVLSFSFPGSLDNAVIPIADITTLTFSIGGFNFNLLTDADRALSAVTFSPTGTLFDITASDEVTQLGNTGVLQISGLQAVFTNISTGLSSTDTITAQPAPTPLPAALPMFVAGLVGATGLLGWRRKRRQAANG
jgi:hypothetical protein